MSRDAGELLVSCGDRWKTSPWWVLVVGWLGVLVGVVVEGVDDGW